MYIEIWRQFLKGTKIHIEESSQAMSVCVLILFRSRAFLLACCVAGEDWAAGVLVLRAVLELLYENDTHAWSILR